jgi:type IV pilus assembly protein PilQ
MRRTDHQRLRRAQCANAIGAARWAVLFACVLACAGMRSNRADAQYSVLHAAFNDVHEKISNDASPADDELRLAAGQKPPATRAVKPAQPVVQKSTPVQNRPRPVSQPHPPQAAAHSAGSTESLQLPAMAETLPLAGTDADAGLQLTKNKDNGLITLIVRDKSLSQVLALIAQTQNLNIVASNDIDALISITLRDVPIEEAMTAILSVANYTWVKRNNIILITSLSDANNLSPDVQGRQVQVFDLDYASAMAVDETVKKLLSPVGRSTIGESKPTNNRLTQERIVVEDLPESLARIADYISQVDQAPRQVLIEAHVLDVKLNDTNSCGVDLNALGLNNNFTPIVPKLATNGLTSASASGFVATLGSANLGAVIKVLQETNDTKTLGSPKVLVLNEQEARIQVGETIYYSQVTTTQTSSQQGAGSVEAGVILRIIPRITRDQRVLLHVAPEVSTPEPVKSSGGSGDSGSSGSGSLPPNISKTTLQTDVMLNDNEGMVIGGLINDQDSTVQSKVPYLGNVRGIGFLFRQSTVVKERHEIIVALVPRIQPYDKEHHDFEEGEYVRASVPLFHGPLCRTDRPWDAVLPDGKRVSYPLIPKKHVPPPAGYFHNLGPHYEIPPYPLPHQNLSDPSCDPACEPVDGGPQGPVFEEELPQPTANVETRGDEIISDR